MNLFIFIFISLFPFIKANMYDIIYDDYLEPENCKYGCANWNDLKNSSINQNDSDLYWVNKSKIIEAKNYCAWPGKSVNGSGDLRVTYPGYAGPFCWCKNSSLNKTWGYCKVKPHNPDQINLQISQQGSVVINFITFCSYDGLNERCLDNNTKPLVEYRKNSSKFFYNQTGITHFYSTPSTNGYMKQPVRHYNMHFIKLDNLDNNQYYEYRVNNGYKEGLWSPFYSMKTIDYEQSTKFAVFGDMGVFYWNNMENLEKDFNENLIDFTIQMGDHSYNIGQFDEHRGDNYLSSYSRILKHMPWMPIVGNHEFYDNEHFHRFLNQTYGVIYNNFDSNLRNKNAHKSYTWNNNLNTRSTATSALGFFQSLGLSYGLGSKGNIPSGTSRYYSVDVGLVHLVGIDTNIYYFDSENIYRKAQLDWLQKDLEYANNNRKNVPWIIVMSHYPLYCTGCINNLISSDWFSGELSEYLSYPPNKTNTLEYNSFLDRKKQYQNLLKNELKCYDEKKNFYSVKDRDQSSIEDLEPIFDKYNVDLYLAGHMHYYESLYPSRNYKKTQNNFTNPQSTVYITSGNGGPPSIDSFNNGTIFSTRKQSKEFSYGRVYAYNNSHLKFQQIINSNNTLLDEIIIIKN